jgi:hypothetical protein
VRKHTSLGPAAGVAAWYALISLGILGASFTRPLMNWDVIGYVGSVKALETSDAQDVHKSTYETLRASVPDSTLAIIAPAPGQPPAPADAQQDRPPTVAQYRSAMRSDPAAFAEQIPLYEVRFLYIYLLFALSKLGLPIVFATYAVSAVSVCIGLWLLAWMTKNRLQTPAKLALPVLALAFGAITIGRLSTPDGLAFLGFMVCMLLFLNNRWESMVVAVALIGIRTDLVLFTAPFLLYCVFFSRFRRVWSIAAFVITCALYVWVKVHYGYPGWSTMFRFAVGEWVPHPLTTPAVVTVSQYLRTFIIGIWSGANRPAFLIFLIMAAWAVGLLIQKVRAGGFPDSFLRSNIVAALVLSIVYVLVHFLLFPEWQERFFLGPYLTVAVVLAILLEGRRNENPSNIERELTANRQP